MANIQLKNIKKIYDKGVVAVDNFNLEISDNEFIVFVGPSGCGKSTTLRMIAGLEEITDGELYIDGKYMNNVAPKDRDIAMVFQNYALYPHMTVEENMGFSLKMHKVKKAIRKAKVAEAAEILGITDLLQRKPKELSGGQRQRVAIGRAIVRNPKVFLMDEPLSNLDAKLRNQMRAEMIKLRQRISAMFVYVTHDQTEAMTLGDRIVVMKDGHIMQIGTPQEVFNTPANKFVAEFIGAPQMNFSNGTLRKENGQYYLDVFGISVLLDEEKQNALKEKESDNSEVIVGIRPEHFEVCAEDAPNSFEVKIDVSEMMGSSIHLHTSLGEQRIVVVDNISSDFTFASGIENFGKVIRIRLNADRIHLFDPETERNLIHSL